MMFLIYQLQGHCSNEIYFCNKFLILYFYLCFNVSALVIGSDEQEIYIDANFTGKDLLVFGAFTLILLSRGMKKEIFL